MVYSCVCDFPGVRKTFWTKLSSFSAENEKKRQNTISIENKSGQKFNAIKIVIFGAENETKFQSVSSGSVSLWGSTPGPYHTSPAQPPLASGAAEDLLQDRGPCMEMYP